MCSAPRAKELQLALANRYAVSQLVCVRRYQTWTHRAQRCIGAVYATLCVNVFCLFVKRQSG